jgi:hypothetical protein
MQKSVHHIGPFLTSVPVHADQAFNRSAEKHMLDTLAKVAEVKACRFQAECIGPDCVELVHVLSEDLEAVQYTMTSPASRFAACSCPVAVQHKPCKHQVAWLLALAPPECQDEAERLVLRGLGTLLGFAGRCSMENIGNLSDALKELSTCDQAGAPLLEPNVPLHAVQNSSEAENTLGTAHAIVAPRLLGPVALQNHRRELRTLLEESLSALERADPGIQHTLALQQKGFFVRARDVSLIAASTAQELKENFASAAEITYKRHKSALEQPRVVKRKARADATDTDEGCKQQDFAGKPRQSDSFQISKPLKGRSAKQASKRMQQVQGPNQETQQPHPVIAEQQLRLLPVQQAIATPRATAAATAVSANSAFSSRSCGPPHCISPATGPKAH